MNRPRLVFAYALLAGAGDAVTGLLLLAAPALTLRLMLIPDLPAEPIFLRWVGAFVLATGLYYFLPWLQREPARRTAELAVVLRLTCVVRGIVALFTLSAVLTGALSWHWLSVTGCDAVTAVLQLIMLRGRWLDAPRD
jgi:hypothetical protein